MSKPWRNEGTLRELYIDQGLSMADVGERLGVAPTTIGKWLHKNNIPTRTVAEGNSNGDIMQLRDEGWLRSQYHDENNSTYDIANDLNVAESIVSKWLGKHSIETRDSYLEQSDADTGKLEDKDWLKQKYHQDGLTLKEVGEIVDCSSDNVKYWLEKHGLGTRSYSESFTDGDLERLKDEKWLREQYHENGLCQREIGEKIGVSCAAVTDHMDKFGIETRSIAESQTDGDIEKLYDEEYLREEYYEKEKTTAEIADQIGVWQQTISKVMERFNLPRRENCHPTGEDHHKYSGDLPSNNSYYGPNWSEQRLKTVIRDQARCVRCGMNEQEHLDEYGRVLDVHHIKNRRRFIDEDGILDYESANRLGNLITFCIPCHKTVERFPVRLDMR